MIKNQENGTIFGEKNAAVAKKTKGKGRATEDNFMKVDNKQNS